MGRCKRQRYGPESKPEASSWLPRRDELIKKIDLGLASNTLHDW